MKKLVCLSLLAYGVYCRPMNVDWSTKPLVQDGMEAAIRAADTLHLYTQLTQCKRDAQEYRVDQTHTDSQDKKNEYVYRVASLEAKMALIDAELKRRSRSLPDSDSVASDQELDL